LCRWGHGRLCEALWGAVYDFVGIAPGFTGLLIATVVLVIRGVTTNVCYAMEWVRREGVPCVAWVKSDHRVSVT
jgi:hypothetical protein